MNDKSFFQVFVKFPGRDHYWRLEPKHRTIHFARSAAKRQREIGATTRIVEVTETVVE